MNSSPASTTYYPGVKEIAADKSTTTLNNGVTVKWTINPNDNNNYQNKLDEALLKQDSAAADDKIDIFLIEADYALKYVDSEYTLDVKKDVDLTDDDLKDQYQYTKDIVTVDGVQKGTTWQATPGLFAYRRSIAEDVLGTDDPTEVQAALSDWDKFNDVAEKAAAKGYKMLSGYDDSYRHVQLFLDVAAEEVGQGTRVCASFRACTVSIARNSFLEGTGRLFWPREKFGDWDNGHLPFPRLRSLCRGWRSIPYWIVRCTAKLRLA